MRMIQRAAINGWDIPDEWLKKLPSIIARIALDDDLTARDRLRAMETLRAMMRDNVDAAVALEKIESRTAITRTDFEVVRVGLVEILRRRYPNRDLAEIERDLMTLEWPGDDLGDDDRE